jgi:hypothetical protein
MKSILNGGLELGIFQIVGDDNLSQSDKERKSYLESLPKNKWIVLDEKGIAVSEEKAKEIVNQELTKYIPL